MDQKLRKLPTSHSCSQGNLPDYTCSERLLGDKKEGQTPAYVIPKASGLKSILESCTRMLGRVLGQVRCGKRNQIIGLKEDKDPEELTYMSDISGSLLCSSSRGVSHTLSLWVCISALLLSQLNKPFLYVLSHLLLCYVSNNKLCTCIYSFCLHEKCIFNWGKIQEKIATSL